jgi:hypothetical protein
MSETSPMIFMSPEHVAHMNVLLASDAVSKAACVQLDRRYDMVYELNYGIQTVWWTMRYDPADGVSFNLETPQKPGDIVFRGDYAAVLDTMSRMKAGDKDLQLPLTQSGDAGVFALIAPAYTAAHAAAAIHTEIPVV